jgi:leucyl-tRNA synthetase
MDYGTGAVMGVPAHDERDWEFAQKFGLEIKPVISTVRDGSREEEKSKTELTKNGGNFSSSPRSSSEGRNDHIPEPYTGPGAIINSGDWNGLQVPENIDKILNDIQNKGIGKRQTTYKLRDWIFSRQHYWGEPIPIIHCQKCGTIPVPEDQLPVTLPKINDYQPTEDGQSPLAKIKEWVKIKCPKCGGSAERETDTMPNWAGSSWYFLRYCDPHNDRQFTGLDKMAYFMPVDIYLGGAEHTTLHLLYSRFWHKILYDLELVLEPEPYRKRRNRGIVLGPDTRKMSKSFGNVINPDDEVKKVGADSLRIYELFMGPLNGTFPWDHRAETGMHRFLAKVWDQFQKSGEISTGKTLHKLHQTIKKVGEDIEQYKFNTAIAAMMELVNVWREDGESLSVEDAKKILLLLAPFTPHIAEELWQQHQKSEVRSQKSNVFNSIHLQPWPSYDETILTEDNVQVPVQVNGRVRATLKVDAADAKDETKIKNIAIADERVQKWIKDKEIQKVVFVPGRLINIVI